MNYPLSMLNQIRLIMLSFYLSQQYTNLLNHTLLNILQIHGPPPSYTFISFDTNISIL